MHEGGSGPDKTGWTLLRRIVTAKRNASPSTAWSTSLLDEKMYAILSRKIIISAQNTSPITVDSPTATMVANFAPFPFPAPSSFATLTLPKHYL